MTPETLVAAVIILLIGALIRGLFGFGDAMFGMPLLVWLVGIKVATPVVTLMATTTAFVLLLRSWRQVEIHCARRLIVGALLGTPLGIVLLKADTELALRVLLSGALIVPAVLQVVRSTWRIDDDRLSYGFGFVAGVLGSAINVNGPPVILYGLGRRWSPEQFVATLQGFFLVADAAILVGHGVAGLWTSDALILYGSALPLAIPIVWAACAINRRFEVDRFASGVRWFLAALGVALFVSVIHPLLGSAT